MTLRKLANSNVTVMKMIESENLISLPAHLYFGEDELMNEVTVRRE